MIKRKYKIIFMVSGGVRKTYKIKCAQADFKKHITGLGEMLAEDYPDVVCVSADECEWEAYDAETA